MVYEPTFEACSCWTEAVDVNSQVLRPAKVAAAQREGYRSVEVERSGGPITLSLESRNVAAAAVMNRRSRTSGIASFSGSASRT